MRRYLLAVVLLGFAGCSHQNPAIGSWAGQASHGDSHIMVTVRKDKSYSAIIFYEGLRGRAPLIARFDGVWEEASGGVRLEPKTAEFTSGDIALCAANQQALETDKYRYVAGLFNVREDDTATMPQDNDTAHLKRDETSVVSQQMSAEEVAFNDKVQQARQTYMHSLAPTIHLSDSDSDPLNHPNAPMMNSQNSTFVPSYQDVPNTNGGRDDSVSQNQDQGQANTVDSSQSTSGSDDQSSNGSGQTDTGQNDNGSNATDGGNGDNGGNDNSTSNSGSTTG